jgi:putative merR family transcriptional regulator
MASSEHYSIKQVSEMSGLPPSTLRYYESIGIIPVISRDSSSKQRVYSEDDLGFIKNVACL